MKTILSALLLAAVHDDGFQYMTTGFDGEFAKLDMEGNALGALGRPGSENGQFGEAHYLALDEDENIADVVNRRIQLYRKTSTNPVQQQ